MNHVPQALTEEVKEREEAKTWDLNPCPCCHAKARTFIYDNKVEILCSQWGCRHVEAKTLSDASALWNEPDFRAGKP